MVELDSLSEISLSFVVEQSSVHSHTEIIIH